DSGRADSCQVGNRGSASERTPHGHTGCTRQPLRHVVSSRTLRVESCLQYVVRTLAHVAWGGSCHPISTHGWEVYAVLSRCQGLPCSDASLCQRCDIAAS